MDESQSIIPFAFDYNWSNSYDLRLKARLHQRYFDFKRNLKLSLIHVKAKKRQR